MKIYPNKIALALCFCAFVSAQSAQDIDSASYSAQNASFSQNASLAQNASAQSAGEFIITYKAMVKNNVLFGEQYDVSKALTQSHNYYVLGECSFIDLISASESSLFVALKNNKDEILECLQKHINANLREYSTFINNSVHSDTRFEVPPQRVLAHSRDGAIKITIIKPAQ